MGDLKNLESIAKTLKEQSETRSELILALAMKLEEERVANRSTLAKIEASISKAREETKNAIEAISNETSKALDEINERVRSLEDKSKEIRSEVEEELTSICNGNSAFKAEMQERIETLSVTEKPIDQEEVANTEDRDGTKRELAKMGQQIKLLEWRNAKSNDDLQKQVAEQQTASDVAIGLFTVDLKQLREALASLKARNDDTTTAMKSATDAQWRKLDGCIDRHQAAYEEMAKVVSRLEVEVKGQGEDNAGIEKVMEEGQREMGASIRSLEREYMYCLKEIAKFHNRPQPRRK